MIRPQTRLTSGNKLFDRVYDLAIEDFWSNVKPWQDGLLMEPAPAIMAGQTYTTPWTRDCAYNTWNAGALLVPEAARNTLISTLMEDDGLVRIGGQYWDAIAWVTGSWAYLCVNGDNDFVELAYEATVNSLNYFEETEFDVETGLFEGPASYGDGVAAYPEPYDDANGSSGILDWPAAHPEIGKNRMKALSTNCLYANAYAIAARMTDWLGEPAEVSQRFRRRSTEIAQAINRHLWLPDKGRYAYFLDHEGLCEEYMEGLGHALVILAGVADANQARQVLANQFVSDYGIPCVWPLFPRFQSDDGMKCGRHNGTVWPFIQGFWASAAAEYRNIPVFEKELRTLAEMADRHHEFKEIYHPMTGEPYGGWQIDNGKMRLWTSEPRQTWSATAYLRMIHTGLFGMRFEVDSLSFMPLVPEGFETLRIGPLHVRDMVLDIVVKGSGIEMADFRLNGQSHQPTIDASLTGSQHIEITMR